jgi:hypothetical protein
MYQMQKLKRLLRFTNDEFTLSLLLAPAADEIRHGL